MNSPRGLHPLVREAVLMKACNLLRHCFPNGLLQFVNRILGVRRRLLRDTQITDRRSLPTTTPKKPPATLRRQRWPLEEPHGVRVEKLLHALEERISAAGQEGRQVCVDLRAHLAALLPTLQLDAEQRKELLICNTFNFNHTRHDGIFQTHNESSCQLNIRKVTHSR